MKVLDKHATEQALSWHGVRDALQQMLKAQREGRAQCPVRNRLPLSSEASAGLMLTMPATDGELAVVKIVTVHGANPAQGLPAVQAAVLVLDARTGERLALLDGEVVTERRTAALSALAVEGMTGRSDWSDACLHIVGAGAQAMAHLEAFAACLGVRRAQVQVRRSEQALAFVEHAGTHGVTCNAVDPRALQQADLIVTATSSATAVIGSDVSDHAVICAVGAFTSQMAELPPDLVRRARCVVDTMEGCRAEAGDLVQASVDWSQVQALCDVTASMALDRPLVFKSVGSALWDLAAARCWQDNAN
jgi:1-piperideine-2-carboxylate/1-pyrroline-2-carboxylate reductase [NAD(P)H]